MAVRRSHPGANSPRGGRARASTIAPTAAPEGTGTVSWGDSLPECQEVPSAEGRLYMVATPIGNREDLSPRARRILETCDLVLAEDTRRALAMCHELGIRPRAVTSFHDHNEQEKQDAVLARLAAGQSLALVTDAGTPLIADPGFRLVRAARARGFTVHPVPGPSAPVAALSAAGLPPLPYTFLGFLPRDNAGRRQMLSAFAEAPTTLAFFERKDRLADTLAVAREILGPRQAAVCRELTKTHEEFILFRLEDASRAPDGLLGEITVLIGPPEACARTDEAEVMALLDEESTGGDRPRDIARRVQARVRGWSVKEVYALLSRRE